MRYLLLLTAIVFSAGIPLPAGTSEYAEAEVFDLQFSPGQVRLSDEQERSLLNFAETAVRVARLQEFKVVAWSPEDGEADPLLPTHRAEYLTQLLSQEKLPVSYAVFTSPQSETTQGSIIAIYEVAP